MERIPSREIYWNLPEHLLLYVLLLPFLAVFLYGCYRRFGALLLGRKGVRLGQPKERLKAFVSPAVLPGGIATERDSGVLHLSLSWGFLVLFIATPLVAFQDYFGLPVLQGRFYLYFMSLTVDLFGVAALLGTLMAVLRRFLRPPARLVKPEAADEQRVGRLESGVADVTVCLVEGLRIM